MEDIFGGPGFQGPTSLGTGPGVIGGETDVYGYDTYRNSSSFEEKFNANNSAYNRDESRDHRDFKPKRDGFESKFAERPDFGDRFTANRNKTHPSNRGRGGGGGGGGGMTRTNGYDKNGISPHNGEKDLPPRFKKMGFGSDRDQPPLRPSANSMMLKPKTPSSLPKSAMQRLEGGMMQNMSSPKVMMSPSEPAVFISKQSGDKKRQEKKNQGPTRDEVFKKIEEILEKLVETESTNEAFTTWKEGDIPNKMVNNALIHFFKQVVKMENKSTRDLSLQLVEQLCDNEVVTQVHCKEGLSRLIQSYPTLEMAEGGMGELSVWSIKSDKVKLADVGEMTEGGSSYPLFFNVLQGLATDSEDELLALFKDSGLNLMEQLPQDQRTESGLGVLLEEMKLSFLVPLLTINTEIWKQLETNPGPEEFLAWIKTKVPAEHHSDPAFVFALMGNILKFITEKTKSVEDNVQEVTDLEKELILKYHVVLQTFFKRSADLQLVAIYALQVFCFNNKFPKGLMLRWFVALYEADIIEEHSFLRWKEDVNDMYQGKGKALFQVKKSGCIFYPPPATLFEKNPPPPPNVRCVCSENISIFNSLNWVKFITSRVKGTDRLCKVVELSMQCCGQIL